MREETIRWITREKVIAILRGVQLEVCLQAARALYEGGIRLVEVTFDQRAPDRFDETSAAIAALVHEYRGRMKIGAGTVTAPELVDLAADAGAEYIIAPDVNLEVIRRTRERGLVSIPGAMSPTEIMTAHRTGADFVKLFPAANLGVEYVKAIRAPISHVRLLAVGGVDEGNLDQFLDAGLLGAGIGGKLVNRAWMKAGQYDKITHMARRLVEIAQRRGYQEDRT